MATDLIGRWRSWVEGGAGCLCSLAILTLLAGCAGLADDDRTRLCRSTLPILDGADQIDIVRSDLASRDGGAVGVTIDYRVTVGRAVSPRVHRIACRFEGATADAARSGVGPRISVSIDDSKIGALRLYLLERNWIARGASYPADPAPFATFGVVPGVPRRVAVASQIALSSLPGISIYALLAAAYALVYGLTGRINLAFGELTILAGFGAFLGAAAVGNAYGGAALVAALVLGVYVAASHGAAMGRWVLAPLVRRPGQHVLIASVGLALAWSEMVRLAQGNSFRWMSPLFNRPLALLRDGSFVVTVTPMSLILPLIAAMASAGLLGLMAYSRFGRRWRAFADDATAAELFGIDPDRMILLTMIVASACAALAGVLTTLFYGGIGFAGGQLVGLKALIAAVIGGLGSVRGALLGGMILGLAETVWSAVFTIESRDPAVFAALVALLVLRPDGIVASGRPSV